MLQDGGHLRCQRVRVEVRLGQVALEVLDEPADGERRQRVGKFRAARHGTAVGAPRRLEQGIAVFMQDETLRARAGASASYGDICALAQDLYTADMDTARTEAAVWTGICIALFAAGALAFAGVCLGHRRGKAVAWCTALAAILSVGCLIAMLAAGHGALRTLCLCAALALLVLAFVATGLTLRQRAQRAQ